MTAPTETPRAQREGEALAPAGTTEGPVGWRHTRNALALYVGVPVAWVAFLAALGYALIARR